MYDSYTSNIPEVKSMSSMIHSMVENQMMLGVKPENIVLGGFSQGGALALYASLTCPVRIGGSFILSAWLLAPWEFKDMVKPSVAHALPNCPSPMLQSHGLADKKVGFLLNYDLHTNILFYSLSRFPLCWPPTLQASSPRSTPTTRSRSTQTWLIMSMRLWSMTWLSSAQKSLTNKKLY
jgi:pimeloyl-ACP methyl ester carboxylesterase